MKIDYNWILVWGLGAIMLWVIIINYVRSCCKEPEHMPARIMVRIRRVFGSCKTFRQLDVAVAYKRQACKLYPTTDNYIRSWLNDQHNAAIDQVTSTVQERLARPGVVRVL